MSDADIEAIEAADRPSEIPEPASGLGDTEFPGTLDSGLRRRLLRKLISFRVESGITQEQLADAMGTAQPAIARLESGAADLKLSTVERYALALGAQIDLDVLPGPKFIVTGGPGDMILEPVSATIGIGAEGQSGLEVASTVDEIYVYGDTDDAHILGEVADLVHAELGPTKRLRFVADINRPDNHP